MFAFVLINVSLELLSLELLGCCRFEIEKKLRQQKRLERAKDKTFVKPKDRDKSRKKEEDRLVGREKTKVKEIDQVEEEFDSEDARQANRLQIDFTSIDHKERSKERKKNIEENRGKTDNKR